MCFCFTSNENFHFSFEKNADLPKRVVDFSMERDTFRSKFMELVEDFDEKSYHNNGKPWKSSRILLVKPKFSFFIIFSFLFIFHFFFFFLFHFSMFCFFSDFSFFFIYSFFQFFIFMFFHFLPVSTSFFQFLSISLIFFHFLSFYFSCLGAQNLIFVGLNFVTISLDSSCVKNQCFNPVLCVVCCCCVLLSRCRRRRRRRRRCCCCFGRDLSRWLFYVNKR